MTTVTTPKTVTLSNDFHNSSVVVRVPHNGVLSPSTTKRVYRELCGISDCTCGGIRGSQELIPDGWCVDTYSVQDRITIRESVYEGC